MAQGDPSRGGPGLGAREAALLRALDPDQRAAVLEPPGPLLVVAGAGSGKTMMLTHRAAWAAAAWKMSPERVLVVSFTRKAVDEMRERLRVLVGHEGAGLMSCLTFHAAAWRLCVRPYRHHLDRPVATIYSHDQSLAAVRRALRTAKLELSPAQTLGRIGWAKAHGVSPSELANRSPEDGAVAQAWRLYRDEMRVAWAVDFEDLMAIALHLLEREPGVRERVQARFDAVLVDEFQDASPIQHRFVEVVCGARPNITAVGDDDQALYTFRGGDARGILEFEERFAGARRLSLGRNYRSGEAIVSAAASLVAHNRERAEKPLRAMRAGGEREFCRFEDQREEAVAAAAWATAQLRLGRSPGELSVLARTGHYTRFVEAALGEAGVPYRVLGKLKLLEHAEVRDVVALLSLVHNPHNRDALGRAAGRVRGLGTKTLGRLLARARKLDAASADLLCEPDRVDGLAPAYRKALAELGGALDAVRSGLEDGGLEGACEAAEIASGWRGELAGAREADERGRAERLAILRELARHTDLEGEGDLEEFLGLIALEGDPRPDDDTEEPDALTVATIHAAKGLEWPCVWIAGASEGVLPHHKAVASGAERAVSEERRVAYVALTRAMDEVVVSAARRIEGRDDDAAVSRFVAEAGLRVTREKAA